MNKVKLVNGIMWLSMAVLFIFTTTVSLFLAQQKSSILFYSISIVCIAGLFFFAYKGMKNVLDAFFDKK